MMEKEEMINHKMYDANYDEELKMNMTKCKLLCQKYNNLPVDDFAARESLIKEIIRKTGDSILIEPRNATNLKYQKSMRGLEMEK